MEVLRRIYVKQYSDIPDVDREAFNYLVSKGVDRKEVFKDIEKALSFTYFKKGESDLDIELVKRLNLHEMEKRRVMPVFEKEGVVHFVTDELVSRKTRGYAEEYAKRLGNYGYALDYFIMSHDFDTLLEGSYKGIDEEDVVGEPRRSREVMVFDAERVLQGIFEKGFDNRASDIHIEPIKGGFQVRYRVDGQLSVVEPFDVTDRQVRELVNHAKIRSRLNIAESRKGQDGSIKNLTYKGSSYDLRISTVPSEIGESGEKVAVRVLDKTTIIPTLEELGFSRFYIRTMRRDMSKHHGLILNTGSVGSGKSTTQSTLLERLDAQKNNIYSIEDPVERTIDYVNHICVKRTAVSFDAHLEALLRQDPDVIAIGEVRNLETMEMALKAALSGQLVFATMHTNSAIEAFSRLMSMGVEMYELGAALVGVSSQRLVRTLCPYCRLKRKSTDVEKSLIAGLLSGYEKYKDINLDKFEYVYDEGSCSHCNHTGYRGRTAVAEYLSANSKIKEHVNKGKFDREELLSLAEDSFLPIEVDALNKALLGKTTVSEIIKVV